MLVHLAARNKIIVIQGHFQRNEASVKQDLSELNVKTVDESARQRALIAWLVLFILHNSGGLVPLIL